MHNFQNNSWHLLSTYLLAIDVLGTLHAFSHLFLTKTSMIKIPLIPISDIKNMRFRLSDLSKVKTCDLYLETLDSQTKTSCQWPQMPLSHHSPIYRTKIISCNLHSKVIVYMKFIERCRISRNRQAQIIFSDGLFLTIHGGMREKLTIFPVILGLSNFLAWNVQ